MGYSSEIHVVKGWLTWTEYSIYALINFSIIFPEATSQKSNPE